MIGPLNNGCKVLKKTSRYEIYKLGKEIFIFIYKSLRIICLKHFGGENDELHV